MARTKGAINKNKKLPEALELITKSISEMEKSITFLAKVRDGKLEKDENGISYDNKDRLNAAKSLADLGKHYMQMADNKGWLSEEDQEIREQKQEEKEKNSTGSIFQLKSFN